MLLQVRTLLLPNMSLNEEDRQTLDNIKLLLSLLQVRVWLSLLQAKAKLSLLQTRVKLSLLQTRVCNPIKCNLLATWRICNTSCVTFWSFSMQGRHRPECKRQPSQGFMCNNASGSGTQE